MYAATAVRGRFVELSVRLALTVAILAGCGPSGVATRPPRVRDGGTDTGSPPGGGSGGESGGLGGTGGTSISPAPDAGPRPRPDAPPPRPAVDGPSPRQTDVSAGAPPVMCGDIPAWMPDGKYTEGSKVANGFPGKIYQCLPWPRSGWCSISAYEPGKPSGPWVDAWMEIGACP